MKHPKRIIGIIFLFMLWLPVAGWGATWYVSGTTGSDTVGDGSTISPWATIQQAVDMAFDGDTVCVAAGTYYEQVEVTRLLSLQGGYDPTTWDRNLAFRTVVDGGGSGQVFDAYGYWGTVIDGFIIQGGTYGVYNSEGSITVSNNVIKLTAKI